MNQHKRVYRPKIAGLRKNIWNLSRNCFAACEKNLVRNFICSTTLTTASLPSRPLAPARNSNLIICSGWKTPLPAELQEGFRLIRQHTTTPLAVGEVFNSIHDCQQLIQEQLIDYIRTTVVHAGGITHLKKIAHLAELYQVRTGSHGATDLSPVCMAAALHFDLSIHNFGIQEYMPHSTETDQVFPHTYRFEAGLMHPGEAPGLGVEIDESLAAKYPYQPAYLPVNRKLDGTMHSW